MNTKSCAGDMPVFIRKALLLLALVLLLNASAFAQSTTFTYQGRLTDGGAPANGSYDLEFKLFDGAGAQVGQSMTREDVPVANGVFTVQLDFGGVFDGSTRNLEIGVRPGTSVDPFTTLAPRQPVTATPEAIHSAMADTATTAASATTAATAATAANATQLGGVAAGDYALASDPRFTDSRPPAAGSANYIQNQNSSAQTATFKINGDGAVGGMLSGSSVNVTNTADGYYIGGTSVLSAPGTNNLFAGLHAGESNQSTGNSFFGTNAGKVTTTGGANSFFGFNAGGANTGGFNSFFGNIAGQANTSGARNAFFGNGAGRGNLTGSNITIIGSDADVGATNLAYATAVGADAVVSTSNTVVLGRSFDTVKVPGSLGVTGNVDVIGNVAGRNITGLTFSGNGDGLSSLNATAITFGTLDNARLGVVPTTKGGTGLSSSGAGGNFLRSNGAAWTSAPLQATDIPVGSANYIQNTSTQQAASNFNISGNGTAGGTLSANVVNATTQYNIGGSRVLSNAGTSNLFAGVGAGNVNTGFDNSFVGASAGAANTTGGNNSFIGTFAGSDNTTGGSNSFIGAGAGSANTTGGGNSFIGLNAGVINTTGSGNTMLGYYADAASNNLINATAIGTYAQVSQDNSLVLGSIKGVNGATADTRVGIGTTAPTATFTVATFSTNAGENTATFRATNIGLNESHIHYGTTGDWYIRSAASAGKVVLQDMASGTVGVGTSTPKAKLDVTGGNILVGSPGQGIILKAPNGTTCKLLSIDNAGAMVLAAIACP